MFFFAVANAKYENHAWILICCIFFSVQIKDAVNNSHRSHENVHKSLLENLSHTVRDTHTRMRSKQISAVCTALAPYIFIEPLSGVTHSLPSSFCCIFLQFMVRIENGRLQSQPSTKPNAVSTTTTTFAINIKVNCNWRRMCVAGFGFSCNLRLVANSCNLPLPVPACHASHVSHWGRICHQPCGGTQRRLKNARITWPLTELQKNYKIVFMLRLFYSRFNTVEKSGCCGSVMKCV